MALGLLGVGPGARPMLPAPVPHLCELTAHRGREPGAPGDLTASLTLAALAPQPGQPVRLQETVPTRVHDTAVSAVSAMDP